MRLVITLGHNSSVALFNKNGKCICAYEEERLTKVKSDSSFPKLVIEECLNYANPKDIKYITISNWFDKQGESNKYIDYKYLERRFNKAIIQVPNENNTHHDMHAQSVWNFSGTESGLTIVADGFGNNEEVISIYRNGILIDRIHGYERSLGLMYQYATAAAGLKENEDEYKLLGYEIKSNLSECIIDMPDTMDITDDRLINYNKLKEVKEYWLKEFSQFDNIEDIAHQAQLLLEHKVYNIVKGYSNPDELIQLSGGIFYNVKLNNLLLRECKKICINPVCGDQGNVFGLDGLYYDNLYLGKRQIKHKYPTREDITESFIGDMEFGPRALCNTSTLALPTLENVEKINNRNNRNTVMPMAPVVTREFFEDNFYDTESIIKSEKYMICSFDFIEMKDEWRGAAHYDPWRKVYTGRVQVLDVEDELYNYIESRGGIMINTSLNYHGTPILMSDDDYINYKELTNEKD